MYSSAKDNYNSNNRLVEAKIKLGEGLVAKTVLL